jgi:hypothetical protein
MPHNSSQWVTHKFDGGWATDYGSTYYASPENGTISIPWLKTCENVRFYPNGSVGKYPGLAETLAAPIKAPASSAGLVESSIVQYLYDYVRMGTSLAGTRVHLAIVGSWLYRFAGSDIAEKIGDLTAVSTGVPHMTTFNDLLIIGGNSPPKSWDQTVFQSLAGTPPAFRFSTAHNGRHWAAGIAATPSKLHYSAVGNPEDWVGAGSGSIDIDPGDGDGIVALLSWKRELWVFKGPHRLSIHRITGSSSSDFARVPFVYGISAAGQGSIFPVGDDFAFWSPRGSCHSLQVTSSYGDYAQSYVNFPILSWCQNSSNLLQGGASVATQIITDPSQNISYAVFNNTLAYLGQIAPPFVLMMDWRFVNETNRYPRFIPLTCHPDITAVALMEDPSNTGLLIPTFGDKNGRIVREWPRNNLEFTVDGTPSTAGNPFASRIETPALTYGPSVYKKTITSVSVDLEPTYNEASEEYGTLQFSYGGRGSHGETISFTPSHGVGLGTFVLGTDQLGTDYSTFNFIESVNGESRAFVYTLVADDSEAADARVDHFGVLYTPSGESLENA